MKRIWEEIKKVFVYIGLVLSAVFVVLIIGEKKRYEDKEIIDDSEEINAKAAAKRQEALQRISASNARTICEPYDTVCDTIAEGKERFRQRCRANS